MATLLSSAKQTYTGGTADSASDIVGYANSKNRVVRFTFTTDATGASSFDWHLDGNYFADGTVPALRWHIGTDASSHVDAGASTTSYSGDVTATLESGVYRFAGSADIVLLPNTTYYLWIFPSVTKYGYFNLTSEMQARLTTAGGAGLVYIDDGSGMKAYQAYIHNGTDWDLCMPHIHDGTNWKLCS